MADSWFRFHNEVLNDPKVQRLPPALFKAWVNLLCIASKNSGVLPSEEDCAFALRETLEAFRETFQALQTVSSEPFFDRFGVSWVPHGWDARQYKSKTSTERVRRFRSKWRNVSETPPDTDTDTDTDTEEEPPYSPPGGDAPRAEAKDDPGVPHAGSVQSDRSDVSLAVTAWNELAAEFGLAKVQKLTDQRRRAAKARLTECGGLDGWGEVLAKIRGSPGLLGDNDRQWRIDFDFLLRQAKFTKIREGGYDHWGAGANGAASGPGPAVTDFSGFFDTPDEAGPRDEDNLQ